MSLPTLVTFTGLCSCQQILIFHLSRPSHHVSSHIFLAFLRRKIRWCPIVYVVLLSFAGVHMSLFSKVWGYTGKGYSPTVCAHPISVMGELYYYVLRTPLQQNGGSTYAWGTFRLFSIVNSQTIHHCLVCYVLVEFCSICSISVSFLKINNYSD